MLLFRRNNLSACYLNVYLHRLLAGIFLFFEYLTSLLLLTLPVNTLRSPGDIFAVSAITMDSHKLKVKEGKHRQGNSTLV